MDREKIWDLYLSKLHSLLLSERERIKCLIERETEREMSVKWGDNDSERVAAYIEVANSFIEERLYAYSFDHYDRFLKTVTAGVTPAELAKTDLSLSWYDWRDEKKEIDLKMEKGLNIMMPPSDIVDELIQEFGAFPNRSIIEQYSRKHVKSYIPDYCFALSFQEVIK